MRGHVGRTVAWMTVIVGLWMAGAAHTPAAAQSGGAPVELRVAWWGSQDRHNRTIKAIELFQKKYPNIKVTYEFAGWGDYWTKMTTQAAGRNLPDVMQQDYAYIAEWSSRGLLAPLDDYVKAGVIDTRDVADAAIKGGVVNGKLVAVNLGSNSQCWVLDVDAFKKAGVELPPPNWTWADFEKTAMALQGKLGIWGMGSQTWDNQIWGALYLSAGQWRYSVDGSRIGYESDKPLVDHFNMLLRLQKANALIPRADELASFNQDTSVELTLAIVSRKAAMAYFWSNQIVAVWKAAGGDERNLVLAPLPRVPGGKSANFLKPSQFFSVTTQAKQPKEAAMFIDFCHELDRGERGAAGRARGADLEQGAEGAHAEARAVAGRDVRVSRAGEQGRPAHPAAGPAGTHRDRQERLRSAGDRPGGVRAARPGEGRRPPAARGERDPRQGEALAGREACPAGIRARRAG